VEMLHKELLDILFIIWLLLWGNFAEILGKIKEVSCHQT